MLCSVGLDSDTRISSTRGPERCTPNSVFLGFRVLRNRRRDEGDEGTGESGGKNEHCPAILKEVAKTAKAETASKMRGKSRGHDEDCPVIPGIDVCRDSGRGRQCQR